MEARRNSTIAPSIRVRDMQKSLTFYTRLLGFMTLEKRTSKKGEIVLASVGIDSPVLILSPMDSVRTLLRKEEFKKNKLGVGVSFRFCMTGSRNLDDYFVEVKGKGVMILEEPKTEFWGDRMFTAIDPDGYTLTFTEHIKDVSPVAWVDAYEDEHKKVARYSRRRNSLLKSNQIDLVK